MKDMEEIRKKIHRAIVGGEIIKVKYMGGSRPGEIREIAPFKIIDDFVYMAICLRSEERKSFRFDKSILINNGNIGFKNEEYMKKNSHEIILGFIEGILSDDVIAIKEIEGFVKFMDEHSEIKKAWPGDAVYKVCCDHISNELRGKSIFQHFLEIRNELKKKKSA